MSKAVQVTGYRVFEFHVAEHSSDYQRQQRQTNLYYYYYITVTMLL